MTQKSTRQKPVFLTQNAAMEDLVKKIKQVAKTGCSTLLISGENGTGKEVVAQLFHYYSSRQDKPMVAVNCGAIPPDLVESELLPELMNVKKVVLNKLIEGCCSWMKSEKCPNLFR